jgi:uncharacterized LabA/DUF88 family protein
MKENNIAYIDGQNLHLWLQSAWWNMDYKRFRQYLKDKFCVETAYYFLWYVNEECQTLYESLQKAWFIVYFREHSQSLEGKKKWNVDTDIVFETMKTIIENKKFDKIVLVSWDWDYIKMVKYLIQKNIFKNILFPNNKYSSLYKSIKPQYGINLSLFDIRKKIEYFKQTKKEMS